MKMEAIEIKQENEVGRAAAADSPISVLEDEQGIKRENGERFMVVGEEEMKNGDSSLLTKEMEEEERKLMEARREDEDEREEKKGPPPSLSETQFSKLDELLSKTQMFTEFLFEKMEDITFGGVENQEEEEEEEEEKKKKTKKRGRGGRGKKAIAQCNTRRAKKAVKAMFERSQEGDDLSEDENLNEDERAAKEQAKLVPLLTGGKLKSYQIKGVKWMISLWQNGLNGILADQMGLGKTVQTIGLIAHLYGKGLHGPYLIVAPLSTLSNWVNEVKRFTPSLNAIVYHGPKHERDAIRRKHMPATIGPDFPLIVTSYEIVINGVNELAKYDWKYVVIDEGHRLKNSKCLLLKKLGKLRMENKLLLTGTPLQNNLAELWSLLHFILPDIFSSQEEFESWFDFSAKSNEEMHDDELEEKRRSQVINKLHMILRPFLLRRLKEDVEQMLPPKKEIILYADMTEFQKKLYDHLVNKTMEQYIFENEYRPKPGFRRKLNCLFMQLRKVCNHPDLLESAYDHSYTYPPVDELSAQCGKFQLLDRLLAHLLARKHKVLIFSQMTRVLDVIDYYLYEKGINACRIDGSVKLSDRQQRIKEFNDIDSDLNVFILSTRAGGLGINLTAADTCIIYDSDWNPQMDLQAMDRCHRIGQTKPVHVYRLATSHSIEGRMLKRAFSKLKLEHLVIEKGQFQQERTLPTTLEESEVLAVLRDEENQEDNWVQTSLDGSYLLKILDRSDMMPGAASKGVKNLPLKGPGWEVVVPAKQGGSMLSSLEG